MYYVVIVKRINSFIHSFMKRVAKQCVVVNIFFLKTGQRQVVPQMGYSDTESMISGLGSNGVA